MMSGGGGKEWVGEVVKYSFLGFVCLVVIFHFFLKYQREKNLKKSKNEYRYKFEWEKPVGNK